MSISQKIDKIIRARWNPGEWFTIQDVVDIAENDQITDARSTIQREMQVARDRGRIRFASASDMRYRGHYLRLPVGDEKESDTHSWLCEAAKLSRNELRHDDYLQSVVARRAIGLMEQEAESEPTKIKEDIREIESTAEDESRKESLIKARFGRGQFRKDVLRMWRQCCAVTGCKLRTMLRASHIKPWRACDDREKMDPYNGLPLIANIDVLFDAGLITFEDDGRLIKSTLLQIHDGDFMGIPENPKVELQESHHEYLDYHRSKIFVGF